MRTYILAPFTEYKAARALRSALRGIVTVCSSWIDDAYRYWEETRGYLSDVKYQPNVVKTREEMRDTECLIVMVYRDMGAEMFIEIGYFLGARRWNRVIWYGAPIAYILNDATRIIPTNTVTDTIEALKRESARFDCHDQSTNR
jgi:hypothetical protein